MKAYSTPFSKIIDIDQGSREHFHVPKYQREYTWGKAQWEQLIADIEDNTEGYFMGSLICVSENQEPAPGEELIYEVIDGQQRLTTLSIMLMALYANLTKALKGFSFEDADDEDEARASLSSLRSKLVKRKKDAIPGESGSLMVGKNVYFLRVQPSTQNHNLADYRLILSEIGLLEDQERPRFYWLRNIYRAFVFYQGRLPTTVPEIVTLLRKINQLVFVQITVGSQSDAFTLFESLNHRGVPLAAIDIIKNKMLAAMDRQHGVDMDDSFRQWQQIVNALPDVGEQERFLRHFYNAFKHRSQIKVETVPRATSSQVIKIYETLIKRDPQAIFDELTMCAARYGDLLRTSDEDTSPSAQGLLELQRIGATPAFQLLLFLTSLAPSVFSPDDFVQTVGLLKRYYVRRNVTDTPATRDMDPATIEVIERCADQVEEAGSLEFETVSRLLLSGRGQPASLEDFRKALSGSLYADNSTMTRYLLIEIDTCHHNREYRPNLWSRDDKGRFVWTVEHVLPQTEKLPGHWVDMLAGGDRQAAEETHARVVHRLGNLTLSGFNSTLAISPLIEKQKLARDKVSLGHKINIGYQNGLALNTLPFRASDQTWSLAYTDKWNEEMIDARTRSMVDIILAANALPSDEVAPSLVHDSEAAAGSQARD